MASKWVDGSTVVVCSPQVLSRQVERLAVLYQQSTDAISHLDEVGTIIWSNLSEPISLAELTARLAALFELPETTLITDLATLADKLLSQELIVVVPADALRMQKP